MSVAAVATEKGFFLNSPFYGFMYFMQAFWSNMDCVWLWKQQSISAALCRSVIAQQLSCWTSGTQLTKRYKNRKLYLCSLFFQLLSLCSWHATVCVIFSLDVSMAWSPIYPFLSVSLICWSSQEVLQMYSASHGISSSVQHDSFLLLSAYPANLDHILHHSCLVII